MRHRKTGCLTAFTLLMMRQLAVQVSGIRSLGSQAQNLLTSVIQTLTRLCGLLQDLKKALIFCSSDLQAAVRGLKASRLMERSLQLITSSPTQVGRIGSNLMKWRSLSSRQRTLWFWMGDPLAVQILTPSRLKSPMREQWLSQALLRSILIRWQLP